MDQKRRRVLRIAGMTGAFAIAGCSSNGSDDDLDSGGTTPLTSPETLTETPSPTRHPTREWKLVVSDGDYGDFIGQSVAVDGDTAVVGAPEDNNQNGDTAGSAYVFSRDSDGWTQQVKLIADDGNSQDRFGKSVAMDGDTAVVGAIGDEDPNGPGGGSAYVFTRDGDRWIQQAKLVPDDGGKTDYFGFSIAIDGDTVVLGAFADNDPNGSRAGSAYVFTRDGGKWAQQAKLVANDGDSGDGFGWSVAVDGDTIVVGGNQIQISPEPGANSAYVFARDGDTWTQRAKLTADDSDDGDRFGESVAVDGDLAIVGESQTNRANEPGSGSAYVFARDGSRWTQQAKLTADDGASGDGFGWSVAMDAGTAVIGAIRDDLKMKRDVSGSAYVFARDGGKWTQQAKLTADDGDTGKGFGWSVAIDDNMAVVGTNQVLSEGLDWHVSAYIFDL